MDAQSPAFTISLGKSFEPIPTAATPLRARPMRTAGHQGLMAPKGWAAIRTLSEYIVFHRKPERQDNHMHMDLLTRYNVEDY